MARIAEGAAVGLRVGLGKDCVAAGASVMHGILVKIAHNAVSASTLLLRKSHRGLGPHWWCCRHGARTGGTPARPFNEWARERAAVRWLDRRGWSDDWRWGAQCAHYKYPNEIGPEISHIPRGALACLRKFGIAAAC